MELRFSPRPRPVQVSADWDALDAEMVELGMRLSRSQPQPRAALTAAERRDKLGRLRRKHRTRKELGGGGGGGGGAERQCAVCMEDMERGGAKVLECGHAFHLTCVVQWAERAAVCPVCRHPIDPGTLR